MRRTLAFVRAHAISILALFVALAGTSYAAAGGSFVSSSGALAACVNTRTGGLHLVAAGSKCRRGQQLIGWNQHGVAGKRGPTGNAGAPGSAGPSGATGATGAAGTPATKLFALVEADNRVVDQQSGGVTIGSVANNSPFTGYFSMPVTFPQNVSACIAMAANAAPNTGFEGSGGTDDHALWTSISGSVVTVYRTIPASGVFPDFAITVFC